jgi:hypothetical protein
MTQRDLENKKFKIILDWENAMEPLREARRNERQVDWQEWDRLTNEMNEAVTELDLQIMYLWGE